MRLGWNEIRQRAREFSERWADARYEKGETQTFYNEFFQVFGIDRKKVAIFERKIEMIDANRRGFIDLFWPSVMLVEQKSAGKSLFRAQGQALDYVLGLKDRDVPRFVLACDFQRFRLLELETRAEFDFTLPQLSKHVERFAFMLGVERRHYGKQAEVNIKAAELLGTVRDALEAKNYRGIDLERMMVRLLFCMFADDTGIFESKDDFLYLIEERTDADGGNVGRVLNKVFEVLDTRPDDRITGGDPEFLKFPYVNGQLFSSALRTAPFDAKMRDDLLTACKFDWGKVSPAIFGSLFQSVMDAEERRRKGAHYTTEPNIMKLIGPLFLDELRAELDRLKARRDGGRRKALLEFQEKLGGLNFIDPACGCGNFLVVTYRELRKLEQEALEQVFDPDQPLMMDVEALSVVGLNQFHGIELEEFPAHIAEVAMWMTEHLANIDLGRTYGKVFADIPLSDSATIVHGDALSVDWNEVLPHEDCFAVMGNPPFVGAKYQSKEQRQQVRDLADLGKSGGTLDFVAAWFLKAGAYIDRGPARIAFVSTNSITQGEQVAQLWPVLFERHGLEIAFAHRTFAWGSDARGKAHVHVVIVGLTHRDYEPKEKRLFSYERVNGEPDESEHVALSAYLTGADSLSDRHIVICGSGSPLSGPGPLRYGSQPIDGGHLILESSERQDFVDQHPKLGTFVRPYVGSKEYINGGDRWILALQSAPPKLRRERGAKERLAGVSAFRLDSKRAVTRSLADYPAEFAFTTIPESSFLVVPEVSSERRDYVPVGWLEPPVIPSNLVRIRENASKFDFAIITSASHMSWLAHVGGRLKSDFRYSNRLVYNTFPWPDASDAQKAKIETLAQAVLDARAAWPTSSLADLYDPDTMPANLRTAHRALDVAVDRLYRRKAFQSDRERVEHLFGLYEKLVNPLEADAEAQNKRTARNRKRRAAKAG
ncbi:MAG: DNA methyltransferase [Pacificimonas sp.]